MSLTPAQLATLKTAILADPALSVLPNTPDGNDVIATAFNLAASPDFYVWRTRVTKREYTGSAGVDVANGGAETTFSWPALIARSVGEQTGWREIFDDGGAVNPSLPSVRQGFLDIFSGAASLPTQQRNHMKVLSERKATRAEKLFATGVGSFANPATMGYEGAINYRDVEQARNS